MENEKIDMEHSAKNHSSHHDRDPINVPGGAFMNSEQKNARQCMRNQVWKRLVVVLLVVAVIGGAVGGVMTAIFNNNKKNTLLTNIPSASPSIPPSSIPSLEPSSFPSFRPSLSLEPSQLPSTTFQAQLISLIQSRSPTTTFEDPTSPQSLALNWMVTQDGFSQTFLLNSNDRLVQRFALVTFWYATGGPTTWDTDGGSGHGWLHTMLTECEWNSDDFASCSSDGFVTALDFDFDRLSGSLPLEAGLLTSLTRLSMRSNDMYGSIPPEIGRLTLLNKLDLWKVKFIGNIPSEMGQLTRLTFLSLSHNLLTGTVPPELGQLTALTELILHRNRLGGNVPSELGQLTRLELLWLWGNALGGTVPAALCATNVRPRIDCGEIECGCCDTGVSALVLIPCS